MTLTCLVHKRLCQNQFKLSNEYSKCGTRGELLSVLAFSLNIFQLVFFYIKNPTPRMDFLKLVKSPMNVRTLDKEKDMLRKREDSKLLV